MVQLGDLKLKILTGDKGAGLDMHNHQHSDVHITVVSRGSIKIHGPTIEETTHNVGAVIDFEEGHPHEIEFMEDNTRIVNIIKWIKEQ